MNKQLEAKTKQFANKYKALGNQITGREDRNIHVECSYRPSRNAGFAVPTEWRITINIPLHEYYPEQLEETVAHEIAHLYAFHAFGDRGHGRSWKALMTRFGFEPNRCHDMHEAARAVGKKRTQYNYQCSICKQILPMGPKRHKHMQQGTKVFWHRGCGRDSVLTFVGKDGTSKAVTHTPTKPKKQRHSNTGGTKREQVETIVSMMHTTSERRQIIETIMERCDMSKAGATTYYQNAKKKLGL